jgi:hypothetical protein
LALKVPDCRNWRGASLGEVMGGRLHHKPAQIEPVFWGSEGPP